MSEKVVVYKVRPKANVDVINATWYSKTKEPDFNRTFKVAEEKDFKGGRTVLGGYFCHHRLQELLEFLTEKPTSRLFTEVTGLEDLRAEIAEKNIKNPKKGGCMHCLIKRMQLIRDTMPSAVYAS